jgi:cytochrome c-type biogenesis protein CcmH
VIAFWIIAALLVAGALAFVLPPLVRERAVAGRADREAANASLYRDELAELKRELADRRIDERQFEEARLEIERRLLEDVGETQPVPAPPAAALAAGPARRTALALGTLLPVVAVLVYLLVGNPRALDPQARLAQDSSHQITREQIEGLAERLAQRLEQAPDDAQGWLMLARSYNVIGRYDRAAEAYARALKLVGENADLLADYADALAMAQGRKLAGEPFKLVQRALKADPEHYKALALAGSAEFERAKYAAAAKYWERSIARIPPDSEFAQSVRASIDEARRLGGLPAAPAAGARGEAKASAPTGRAISGTVKLAPALAGRVAPSDTLFVFARTPEGGRMPIAIVRASASDLPYAFRLDDSTAMTPNTLLSDQSRVLVDARVSKSGSAIPQPGDLQGTSAPVAPGAKGLVLTIDRVVE